MKAGVKEMKKEYKKVNIDKIEDLQVLVIRNFKSQMQGYSWLQKIKTYFFMNFIFGSGSILYTIRLIIDFFNFQGTKVLF